MIAGPLLDVSNRDLPNRRHIFLTVKVFACTYLEIFYVRERRCKGEDNNDKTSK
jgi:hypothetical protein